MTDKSIFCTSCGAANHPEARFCYQCGAAILKVGNSTPVASPAQPVPPSPQPAPANPAPLPAQPKRREKKPPLFSNIEIIVGSVAAALLYLILSVAGIVYCTREGMRIDNIGDTIQASAQEGEIQEALARFDTYQSYTINSVRTFTILDGDQPKDYVSYTEMKVNRVDGVSLAQQESADSDFLLQLLCISDVSYISDNTGQLKPSSYDCATSQPAIRRMELDLEDIQQNEFIYIGEEILESGQARKYELVLTDAQVNNPDLRLAVSNPVVYFYVGETDGNLLRMEYVLETLTSPDGYHYREQETLDFSGWDATSFTVPEYVELDDTNIDTFTGGSVNTISFQYPRPYQLSGDGESYIFLYTPEEGQLYFYLEGYNTDILGDFESAILLDELLSKDSTCDEFANEFILDWESYTHPVLVSQTRIEGSDINACQAVLNDDTGVIVYYLIVEPYAVAKYHGRTTQYVYLLEVAPAENEDPAAIFREVIQSIRFE